MQIHLIENVVLRLSDTFTKLKYLNERKRKNEENIPAEVLQTKYKDAYEKLLEEIKETQCHLKLLLTKDANQLVGLMLDVAYMDFSDDSGYEQLRDKVNQIYSDNCDPIIMELLIGLMTGIEKMES